MRLIGHVANESSARIFGNYLYVQGIDNQLEFQDDNGWGVWIMDEDHLDRARSLLETFRTNPKDPKFQAEGRAAEDLRARKEKEEKAWRKRLLDRRHLFRPLTGYGFGPLTMVLILACVVVFVITSFGNDPGRVLSLFISEHPERGANLPEIRHWEIWRLLTPIFIHFSILHIFFNMLWLRDLGSMIEGRQSTLHLTALVVVIAVSSNLAQYYAKGPVFGGMSGVVYGLFGYIWIRGRYDPASGLFLHRTTVTMMLIWLVLCFTGLVGPIANIVHVVGLIVGAAWGYLSSLRWN